jgi:large subunit ribosomal protein L24e
LRDSRTFLFLNAKIKSLFGQRKKPAKIAWTVAYRKEHKKDQSTVVKQKKRKINKNASKRSCVFGSFTKEASREAGRSRGGESASFERDQRT